MAEQQPYDLIVIGSGPGGYVAAIRAAQLGLRTAVIEKAPKPGGTCLHTGCIPTKVLLHIAAVYSEIQKSGAIGINVPSASIDYAKVNARKDAVVGGFAKAVEGLFKRRKVDLFVGTGTIADTGAVHTIDVKSDKGDAQRLTAKKLLLATGSAVRSLPNLPVDGKTILSSDDILKLARGAEDAARHRRGGGGLRVRVGLPALRREGHAGRDDADAACRSRTRRSASALARGVREAGDEGPHRDHGEKLKVEKGDARRGRAQGQGRQGRDGLVREGARRRRPEAHHRGHRPRDTSASKTDKGYVIHDPRRFETNVKGIYAIGDIIKAPRLAHAASHEGIHVVTHLAGKETEPMNMDKSPTPPTASPRSPRWASRRRRRRAGYDVRVGKFPFVGIGRPLILGQTRATS